MKIGFIGYGEAAYNISLGLRAEGLSEMRAYDVMLADAKLAMYIQERAQEACVTLESTGTDVADWADIVVAAVPSSYALDVCKEIKDHLRSGQFYVDVSASTPATKKEIWELLKESGVLFVDAAMLGSLPKDKHQVPITASGNGAAAFEKLMTPYGMKITLAGEEAGAASAIKLVRSIFMKGIATLMIEMLQAGDAYGVTREVVDSISESLDGIPFTSHLKRLVTGTAIHCVRRGAELKGAIAMLTEAGLSADMTVATKQRMKELEPYQFAMQYVNRKPAGWEEIIALMRVK